MRNRAPIAVCFVAPAVTLLLLFGFSGTSSAQSTTIPAGSVNIGDGFAFTSAVVHTPDQPDRSLDAYHTAVFVQAWLGEAFWGHPDLSPPPDGLPVSRVDVTGSWGGTPPGATAVYYMTDGKTAWISWPQEQVPTTEPITSPPPPTQWFKAPDRTVQAFNGTAELIPTAGVESTIPSKNPASAAPSSSSSDNSGVLLAVAAIIVVAVGAALVVRRRREQSAMSAEAS